jgi:chromosome segregation ATPase
LALRYVFLAERGDRLVLEERGRATVRAWNTLERADRHAADARADADTMRADHADQALTDQWARTDALQERIERLLSQIATAEADAKTARDRAWASGETVGALREQLATTERRFDAERKRAERAEKQADDERQELLDAESKTWRTLGSLEAADKQIKQLKARLAEVEAAAETALQSANAFRQEAETRRSRGLLSRLRARWRGKEKRVAP